MNQTSVKSLLLVLSLMLFPLLSNGQNDGIVQFDIGEDPAHANVMAVVNSNGGMINIYRYNAYEHADRMPMPFHKDDSLHIWSYRCKGQTTGSWILFDERTITATTSTFNAMKDVWLTFKEYSDWWLDKNGVKGDGKIYKTPSKKGAVIPDDSIKCRTFKVVEVSGDWMKVSYSPSGCSVADVKTLGWIMWRRKGQMLVNFR